jgi:hypothetical protein
MIHYSVSDSIAEIRIDHPPVNGLGVVMIAALGRAAPPLAAAMDARQDERRPSHRPRQERSGAGAWRLTW